MINRSILHKLLLLIFLLIFISCDDTQNIKEYAASSSTLHFNVPKVDPATVKKLNDYFERRYKKIGFNGAVLFAENGNIVYEKAFGYSDFKTKKNLTLNTRFQIASVSKPFTSYAIMLLKQRGKLNYGDTIQKYFPDFPYEGITIKLLLIHKSGLPEYFYFSEELWPDKHKAISNKDVIDLMIKHTPPRYYLPDNKYNYINTNYCVLAAIVEKISGLTFGNFMKREIFEPLEMNNTFIYNKYRGTEIKNAATGYTKRRRKAEDSYLNGVVGDKGIYTTVEDMFKFDQALYKGTLVNKELINEAFKPAHKRLYLHDNYGFGWRINAADSKNKIVYHTGWWKGFRSYFIRELGKKKTIIVLSNTDNRSVFGTNELIKLF